MTMNCEICGGRIYTDEPTVEIRMGRFSRFLSSVHSGSKAVVHLDCIDFDGYEISESGKVARELAMESSQR